MAATTLLNGVTANGAGTPLDCTGALEAVIQVRGSFEATIFFEASLDGTNWFPYEGKLAAGRGIVNCIWAPAALVFRVGGVKYLRPVVANYKQGAITAVGYTDVIKVSTV